MNKNSRTIIIAGLYLNGISVVRSLAKLGYNIIAISNDRGEEGFYSRYGKKMVCPDPEKNLDLWISFMQKLASSFKSKPILFPTSDRFVIALEKSAKFLLNDYLMHIKGDGVRIALTSKIETSKLALKHTFPIPKTSVIENKEDIAKFLEVVNGKIVLKPDYPLSWREGEAKNVVGGIKVFASDSINELLKFYDSISQFTSILLAQEFIPGNDSNLLYWCGFMRPDGEAGGRFVGEKVRVLPPNYGSASFVRLIDKPEIEHICIKFLQDLKYIGICGIELKIDPIDNIAKLIEINPRYGLWDEVGIPVGVDLAQEAVSSLLCEEYSPKRANSFNQKWVSLERDISSFLLYKEQDLLSIKDWLRSLLPPIMINDFPLSDIPYCLYKFWKILILIIKIIYQKMLQR